VVFLFGEMRVMLRVLVRASHFICGLLALTTASVAADKAHFRVTNEVVQSEIEPFTATIGKIGDDNPFFFWNNGFEPVVYRDKLIASASHPNRLYASPTQISNADRLQTGALDGADVQVYRIVDGRFLPLRQGRVVAGGHQVSGFQRVLGDRAIRPKQSSFTFSWKDHERKGVPAYYAIQAVDKWGRVSGPSNVVEVGVPETVAPKHRDKNVLRPKFERSAARGNAPDAPSGVTAKLGGDGVVEIKWKRVRGDIAGYYLLKSDTPPATHQGFYLELDDKGPDIVPGDLAFVSKKLFEPPRAGFVSHRVWNSDEARKVLGSGMIRKAADRYPGVSFALEAHDGDAIPDGGESYLSVRVDAGEKMDVGGATHSGSEQDFYEVMDPGKTYEFSVWMRGAPGTAVDLRMKDVVYGPNFKDGAPVRFTVGRDWKRYVLNVRAPTVPNDAKPRWMQLRVQGPGQVDIDNFAVVPLDSPGPGFSEREAAQFKASGMSAIRFHAHSKTKNDSYDLEQLTNPAALASGIRFGQTLPKMFNAARQAGAHPWLQIEPHFTREEWLGLAEYLAAPYVAGATDRPWASKRAAAGQAAPWIDEFDRIYFEVGNETWNGIMAPWNFKPIRTEASGQTYSAAAVYGMYNEYVLQILKESPYWEVLEPKLVPVIGGWNAKPEWGAEAMAKSPSAKLMSVAAYNGGWDEGEGPPQQDASSFFNLLNQVSQAEVLVQRHAALAQDIRTSQGRDVMLGTYEGGPGYAMNGLNGARVSKEQMAEQELVMKSIAAGTATLDNFLMRMTYGFKTQNFFMFGIGTRWRSHAPWYQGGQAYPSWQLLSLFNTEAGGDMLNVEMLDGPTATLPAYQRRKKISNAPQVAAYATRDGDRFTLTVISRRVPGHSSTRGGADTDVLVDLPFSSAAGIEVVRFNAPYDAENTRAANAVLVREPHEASGDLARFDAGVIPPGQAVMYIFTGVSG